MRFAKPLFVIFVCLFIFGNETAVFPKSIVEIRKNNSLETERKIFELINKERNKKGIEELIWNPRLAELARAYSEKMARERFFSHFDREGRSVAERANSMKITRWRLIGENLFMGDEFSKIEQTAVKGWMKSLTHRENILEGRFNETGIGLARSRDGMIYITQVFIQK